MLLNKIVLEVKTGEKVYQFLCANDSPLGEAFDALSQMKSFIIEKMQEAEKKVEAPKE